MTKQSHIDVNQTVECPAQQLLKSGTTCYTTHASHIEFKHNLGNLQPLPVWNDCKWLAVVHQNRNNDLTMVQAAQFPFVTN